MATETELERMVVRLVGDASRYQGMLKDAKRSTQEAARSVESAGRRMEAVKRHLEGAGRALQNVGRSMARIGRSLTMRVTAPIVGAGAAVFKFGSDFEAEMSKIVGLVGIAQRQVDAWSRELLELGPALSKTPIELARAMFFVTSAGFRGAEAMDTLTLAAKASASGMGETKTVADAVTSAVNAYGKANLEASRATDILVAAVREGKLEAATLAPVMGRILPMSSKLGVSFEDVAGSLAVMSRTGANAHQAAISIQALMMTLQKPVEEANKLLEGTTLSFQQLRDVVKRPGGILEALRMLEREFRHDETALARIIPNVRALRGVMNILAQDASIVDSVMRGVRVSAGSLDAAFAAASRTVKFQFHQFLSQAQATLIEVGETVLPMVSEALQGLTGSLRDATKGWANLDKSTKKAIVWMLGAAAVVGPILIGLASLVVIAGGAVAALAALKVALITGVLATAAVTAAVYAFATAMVLSFTYGVYLGAKALYNFMPSIKAFNREMAESKRLTDELNAVLAEEQQEILNLGRRQAESGQWMLQPQEFYWTKEVERAETEIEGLQTRIKATKREIDDLAPTWKSLWQAGRKEREVALVQLKDEQNLLRRQARFLSVLQTELDKVRAARKAAADEAAAAEKKVTKAQQELVEQAKDYVKQLGFQAVTFGKTGREAEIYRLSMLGVEDSLLRAMRAQDQLLTWMEKGEEARKKRETEKQQKMEEGKRITEQYLAPQEWFAKRQKDLADYLRIGAIGQKTYNRAMKAARERLEELRKAGKIDIEFNVRGIEAVRAGSAEAIARIKAMEQVSQVQERRLGAGKATPVPVAVGRGMAAGLGGVTTGNKVIEAHLRVLVELARAYWRGEAVSVEGADLED